MAGRRKDKKIEICKMNDPGGRKSRAINRRKEEGMKFLRGVTLEEEEAELATEEYTVLKDEV
ncbi:hypothetical protein SK128_006996 [Halocaridina rubra]|uniref:Uncharacterized protein n=1 Tax=Halocaridina rubra TaxID=373956 RepID=A0AAN8X6J4_HALRR